MRDVGDDKICQATWFYLEAIVTFIPFQFNSHNHSSYKLFKSTKLVLFLFLMNYLIFKFNYLEKKTKGNSFISMNLEQR